MNGQLMGNQDCALFMRNLDAYIDGALTDAVVLDFRAHAAACESCGAELYAAEALSKALAGLDEGVVMPLSGQAAWRNAVRGMARKRKPAKNAIRAFVSMAASLAVLVAGTAYMRSGNAVRGSEIQTAYVSVNPDVPVTGNLPADTWVSAYVQTDGAFDDIGTKGTPEQKMIIKRAERAIDTKDFDTDEKDIKDLVSEYGGYFADSRVNGAVTSGARTGNYFVRVPAKQLSDFLTALSGVGETVFAGDTADDITSEYKDVESRLAVLDAQLSRLRDLIEAADVMEDVISIGERAEQILGEIDRIEAQRSGYSGDYDESRVLITLTERAELYGNATLAGRMSAGFSASRAWLGGFLRDMAVTLAYAAPVLSVVVPLIVIVAVIVYLTRKKHR